MFSFWKSCIFCHLDPLKNQAAGFLNLLMVKVEKA